MRYYLLFFLMAKLGVDQEDEPSITNLHSRNLSNSFFIAVNASGDCGYTLAMRGFASVFNSSVCKNGIRGPCLKLRSKSEMCGNFRQMASNRA